MNQTESFYITAGFNYERGLMKGSRLNELLAAELPAYRDEAKRLIEIGRREAR
jgi:hypothetical protein